MTDSWELPAPLATAEVRMDDGALTLEFLENLEINP